MMSVVQERDLTAIGADVEMPAAAAYGSGRARRQRRTPDPAGDRLAELAAWWVTVAGTARPRRVEQLWLPRATVVGRAAAEVVIRPFDAPKAIPEAIAWGIAVADDAVDEGTDLLLVSLTAADRDDLSWQVLAAHLLDLDPVEATGWAMADRTTDREWAQRVAAIRDGRRRLRGIRNEPERLLAELDSPALAAGTGLLVQAAARRTPALLDGPGAAACALLAHRIGRATRSWWQAADAGHRGLHDRVLTELRLPPLTRFGLPDEDGTAARIALGLLETAVSRAIEAADNELDEDLDELDEELGVLDEDPAALDGDREGLDELSDEAQTDQPQDAEAQDDQASDDQPQDGEGPAHRWPAPSTDA
jgi:hypothetical protein